MVGREDERGADERRLFRRHVPGGGDLFMNRAIGEGLAGHGGCQQTQDACAGFEHCGAILDPAWMIPARRGRQENEAGIDRGQGGCRLPGAAQRGRQGRQVARGERAVVAIPQELSDLFEGAVAREPSRFLAPIEEAAVLDQRQRRFQDRRAEVERVGGDRLGLAADVPPPLQLGDVVGPVAPLTLPVRAFGAQEPPAHISVQRGGRNAEASRRFLRTQPVGSHFLLWINSVNIDNT